MSKLYHSLKEGIEHLLPHDMSPIDAEQQRYEEEVEAVKQWWNDSRWRFTKRPFTAEQIVSKRGNLKIQYPSAVMAKKLWNTVEKRFQVSAQ